MEKEEYLYKFVYALALPDNSGAAELKFELTESQYEKVKSQVIGRQRMVTFVQTDGEPITFSLAYPVVYARTEKMVKPKILILPDGKGLGKEMN